MLHWIGLCFECPARLFLRMSHMKMWNRPSPRVYCVQYLLAESPRLLMKLRKSGFSGPWRIQIGMLYWHPKSLSWLRTCSGCFYATTPFFLVSLWKIWIALQNPFGVFIVVPANGRFAQSRHVEMQLREDEVQTDIIVPSLKQALLKKLENLLTSRNLHLDFLKKWMSKSSIQQIVWLSPCFIIRSI